MSWSTPNVSVRRALLITVLVVGVVTGMVRRRGEVWHDAVDEPQTIADQRTDEGP